MVTPSPSSTPSRSLGVLSRSAVALAAVGFAGYAVATAPRPPRVAPPIATAAPAPVAGKASPIGAAAPRAAGFVRLGTPEHSVARRWVDVLMNGIRGDFARPTVHARNLFHISTAMYDAWAAYDLAADGVIVREKLEADDIEAARAEAISYAAYRLMISRFAGSPGVDETLAACEALMADLGYDPAWTDATGDDPASFGNRIALEVKQFGYNDNSNEVDGFANQVYEPVNQPLIPDLPGNPTITDPNRWQPLSLDFFIDQSGNPVPLGYPEFLSPEWGDVTPFSLTPDDAVVYQRDGYDWVVPHDPGPPPLLGGEGDEYYKWGGAQVVIWSSHLDASDGVTVDISPRAIGGAPLMHPDDYADYYKLIEGGDIGPGYKVNPVTGEPYEPQIVPRGDYGRILAEFWADGPDSETPPGHWFEILNYVSDHPLTEKRIGGTGPVVSDLEWDVKSYLAMGGAMHDVAIAAWGVKGWYDYIRPISAIRYMADRGQSSDPKGPSYHEEGIPLYDGLIEVVTEASIAKGERHAHLAGENDENLGKIAILAWRGHDLIEDPAVDVAGVGWILAENWWPYQRPSFVTPPFAGYVSGHSTYSRAAARIMESITGSEYFPGGLGEFFCPAEEFLVFEDGPSVDVTLQWARYMDASDQCSLSRIWGGIHPGADDLPGRWMGEAIGPQAWMHARRYFAGVAVCGADLDESGAIDFGDLLGLISRWGACEDGCRADLDLSGDVGPADLVDLMSNWGACSP